MRDALKNYLALAGGLTEVSKQQAKSVAKSLVKQGEATRGQVDRITEDLVSTSRANRAVIVSIVRTEVDKALGRLGLATADEVGKLSRRLQDLEGALRSAVDDGPAATKPSAAKPATRTSSARPATKATASKATASKPAAAKPAGKPAARKPAAKKATAKTPTKKATAKKAPAKAGRSAP